LLQATLQIRLAVMAFLNRLQKTISYFRISILKNASIDSPRQCAHAGKVCHLSLHAIEKKSPTVFPPAGLFLDIAR
jgi:hypothetical protein